jgi:hypothetical protein
MKAEDLVSMILVLGVLPITILLIVFFIQNAKIKERRHLLEKGIDISTLRKTDNPFNNPLLWGLTSLGGGFGLLIGFLLLQNHICSDDAIMGILALIFGGIALIIFYFINKKQEKL